MLKAHIPSSGMKNVNLAERHFGEPSSATRNLRLYLEVNFNWKIKWKTNLSPSVISKAAYEIPSEATGILSGAALVWANRNPAQVCALIFFGTPETEIILGKVCANNL